MQLYTNPSLLRKISDCGSIYGFPSTKKEQVKREVMAVAQNRENGGGDGKEGRTKLKLSVAAE